MVRNTTGGSRHKHMARRAKPPKEWKHVEPDNITTFRARVVRGLGDRRLEIETLDTKPKHKMVCRIPGRFGKKTFFFNNDDHVVVVCSKPIGEDGVWEDDISEVVAKIPKDATVGKHIAVGEEAYAFGEGGDDTEEDAPPPPKAKTKSDHVRDAEKSRGGGDSDVDIDGI